MVLLYEMPNSGTNTALGKNINIILKLCQRSEISCDITHIMENPESNLMGSGERAMEANKEELAKAQEQMRALEERAARGEQVDEGKVRQLHEIIRNLKEDKGRIEAAGM